MAGAHIEAFKIVTGANVTAVSSRRPQDSHELEARYGQPLRPHASFPDRLADKDVLVIDICTPHHLHAEQAVAAAEAGKHLLIEKPVATTCQDAERIRHTVKASGVQAMVCFECRYCAHFRMVRSLLDQGLVGELHYGEVEEVTAHGTRSKSEIFAPYEYDTTTVTPLRFKDGRVGKCASVVDCLQPYYFHVHLVGSHGSVLDSRFYSHKLDGQTKDRWSTLETSLIDSGDVSDHPYQPQFQAFADPVAVGRPMPWTDLATGLETHRVMFAADRSAAEGRPVRLADL